MLKGNEHAVSCRESCERARPRIMPLMLFRDEKAKGEAWHTNNDNHGYQQE